MSALIGGLQPNNKAEDGSLYTAAKIQIQLQIGPDTSKSGIWNYQDKNENVKEYFLPKPTMFN